MSGPRPRPVWIGRTRYSSIFAAAACLGFAYSTIWDALRFGSFHGLAASFYPPAPPPRGPRPESRQKGPSTRLLAPGLCTHRLGAYVGGAA